MHVAACLRGAAFLSFSSCLAYSLSVLKEYNAAHEATNIYWKLCRGRLGGFASLVGCRVTQTGAHRRATLYRARPDESGLRRDAGEGGGYRLQGSGVRGIL